MHVYSTTTLETNGCVIYCRELLIDESATIDAPDNVILMSPPCPADLDSDGVVGGSDLAYVLGAWGINDSEADPDPDGDIDGADLAVVLGAWGVCSE